MRITQLLTFNGLQKHLNRNREELAKFQEQLSSGKRVVRASDDSVSFTTSKLLKESARKNEQYQRNISSGLNKARSAQDSLDSMIDIMIELKSIAVQGSSDSVGPEERTLLADQVSDLKESVFELGNAKFNDTYLFGGTNSDTKPFSLGGGPGGVSDSSSNNPLKVKVSEIAEVETSVTGNELRTTGAGDLFAIIDDLETNLRTNNRAQVSNQLADIEEGINHISNLTSRVGNNINRMDFISGQLESKTIEQKGEISRLTDTDYAEAITNFQKFQTGYEAALAAHSKMTQTSLLKYI